MGVGLVVWGALLVVAVVVVAVVAFCVVVVGVPTVVVVVDVDVAPPDMPTISPTALVSCCRELLDFLLLACIFCACCFCFCFVRSSVDR